MRLSDKTLKKLAKLAKDAGLSQAQIVETLVDMAEKVETIVHWRKRADDAESKQSKGGK